MRAKHLIKEYGHDSRDEATTWCGESGLGDVATVDETNCPECLKAIIRLADDAKEQLDVNLGVGQGAAVSKIT